MQHVAIVLRKHPDGFTYVPWDEDPHPSRAAVRAAIMTHLVDGGHSIEQMEGGHIKLLSGPLA